MSRKVAIARSIGNEWARPVDWGRGKAVRIVLILMVIVMLSFNLSALFLSVPRVIDGLPDEHRSWASGTMRFPYIPGNGSVFSVDAPENIEAYTPFTIRIGYEPGRIPYGFQTLTLTSPSGRSVESPLALGVEGSTGEWEGAALVQGLTETGQWNMTLSGNDGPGGIDMYIVPLTSSILVDPLDDGSLDVVPDLGPDRSVVSYLSLRTGGRFEGAGRSIPCRIDGGPTAAVPYRNGARMDAAETGPGWHVLTIDLGPGRTVSYPFRTLPDGNRSNEAPDITILSTFGGKDGAFSQDSTAPVTIVSGDEEAMSDSYYALTMRFTSDPRLPMSDAASEFSPYIPAPPMGVKVGDRFYPASMDEDGASFSAVIFLDGDMANGSSLKITAGPLSPGSGCRPREFALTLVRSQTPTIELVPDPFLPRRAGERGSDHELRISDSPYDLGRKDFEGDPEVSIDGLALIGAKDRPYGYWTEYRYEMGNTVTRSGSVLTVDVNTTFQYRDDLFVLLPIPPFLFGIETPLAGVSAVVWFILLAACIVVSIAFLFRQEASLPRRGVAGPGSPLYVTSMTYAGILFFSVAVIIAFNMLDQSTPSPSILSQGTPVHFRMLMLAEASVWEEVVSRIVYIGAPLLLVGMFTGRKGIAGGLLGGTGRTGPLEAGLIITSASLFGIAHLGWGPWKVLPTFVSGLLLGYLFVKVGVHASIAVHFLIDYSSFLWEISPAAEGFVWVYVMILFALIGLGAFQFGRLAHLSIEAIGKRIGRRRAFLIAAALHSATSIILALLIGKDSPAASIALMATPVGYLCWFTFGRVGLPWLGRTIVAVLSLPTLVLAPLGIAFVMADSDGGIGQ